MAMTMEEQIQALDMMNGTELKTAYMKVFGERPHSQRHQWLRNRIAWGLQAKAWGGMSQRFTSHGLANADLSELRVVAPRNQKVARSTHPVVPVAQIRFKRDPRIPMPGTTLEREYKGRKIQITVLETGFEWNGTVYNSFSKAVKTATGASYSPFEFFKLGPKKAR